MGITALIKKLYKRHKLKSLKKSVVNAHHDSSSVDLNKVYDARKYDFSMSESQVYSFPKNNMRDYITTWEAYKPRLSNKENSNISDNKFLFSLVFEDIVEVPKTYAIIKNGVVNSVSSKSIDNSNIIEFIKDNKGVVLKDISGFDGFGVHVIKVFDGNFLVDDCEARDDEVMKLITSAKNAILQNILVQGEFENRIYNRTVNTIRIITQKKKNSSEHEIIGAVQRIGTSRSFPVDNFNQGGGSALIDIETGELSSMTCIDSFDENGNRIFYDRHPDSGSQIKGAVIPCWSEVKEKIKEVTRKRPLFNFIAWDVVLKDSGIAIIEINMKSSLNLFQVHGGMRNSYIGLKYKEYGYLD